MTDILGNHLNLNVGLLLPELVLAAAAVLVVFFDMFWEKAGQIGRAHV